MPGTVKTLYKVPVANKPASLIYFNYGDSKYKTLFQETLHLKKGMEDYNRKVLLKYESTPSWLDLSEKDEKLADIKDVPTKTNLFKYLIQLAEEGYFIDLFIFAHGDKGYFGQYSAAEGTEHRVTSEDILDQLSPAKTGFVKMPIRVVWGTNCYGQTLGETWRSVGAKTTAGAQYVNFYPTSWGNFIDDWNKGNVTFDNAVANADTATVRTVVQTYIRFVDAPSQEKAGKWDGCPGLKTVLGDDSCARQYFLNCWIDPGEWRAGKDGKENMNISSFMFRGGEKTLTKNSRPRWS